MIALCSKGLQQLMLLWTGLGVALQMAVDASLDNTGSTQVPGVAQRSRIFSSSSRVRRECLSPCRSCGLAAEPGAIAGAAPVATGASSPSTSDTASHASPLLAGDSLFLSPSASGAVPKAAAAVTVSPRLDSQRCGRGAASQVGCARMVRLRRKRGKCCLDMQKKSDPHSSPVAWEPDSEYVALTHVRQITQEDSIHHVSASDSDATTITSGRTRAPDVSPTSNITSMLSPGKRRGVFRFYRRRVDPRTFEPWGLISILASPPPEVPPTIKEFAAAVHHDMRTIFATHRTSKAAGKPQYARQPPCGAFEMLLRDQFSVVQRRRDISTVSSTADHQFPDNGSRGSNSGRRVIDVRDTRGPLPNSPAESIETTTWDGSPAARYNSYQKNFVGYGRHSSTTSNTSTSIAKRLSSILSGHVSNSPVQLELARWMLRVTVEEQQLITNIVTDFVKERTESAKQGSPAIPDAVAREAMDWMCHEGRTQDFSTVEQMMFTGRAYSDGWQLQIITKAFVFSNNESLQQTDYMRKVLSDFRGLFWAMKNLKDGTVTPWQAAREYQLYVPLDVAVVEGKGLVLPASSSMVVVNGFVTHEHLLCTLHELLQMRPTEADALEGVWHLILVSLSVQVVDLLSKLSEEGIPVAQANRQTLALSARGALVLTSVKPAFVVPGLAARTGARLLFQLWCRGSYSIYRSVNKSFQDRFKDVCSPRMPQQVKYAVEALYGIYAEVQMSLQELQSSHAFKELAASVPVLARKLRQKEQGKSA